MLTVNRPGARPGRPGLLLISLTVAALVAILGPAASAAQPKAKPVKPAAKAAAKPIKKALTADQILTRALNLSKGILDYTSAVTVVAAIPGQVIPPRTAKVYVKLPDKVYVESKGIVMIPKEALTLGGLADRIRRSGKVSLLGKTGPPGAPVYGLLVTMNPPRYHHGPSGRAPTRAKLWVDGRNWTLMRTVLLSGDDSTMEVDWKFALVQGSYWMPSRVVCVLPGGMLQQSAPGTVTIAFSDTRVNTGLTDEFFRQRQR